MATEEYVAVTGDDWYERRRDDTQGKFFRSVADQGPRKGEGGSTRHDAEFPRRRLIREETAEPVAANPRRDRARRVDVRPRSSGRIVGRVRLQPDRRETIAAEG